MKGLSGLGWIGDPGIAIESGCCRSTGRVPVRKLIWSSEREIVMNLQMKLWPFSPPPPPPPRPAPPCPRGNHCSIWCILLVLCASQTNYIAYNVQHTTPYITRMISYMRCDIVRKCNVVRYSMSWHTMSYLYYIVRPDVLYSPCMLVFYHETISYVQRTLSYFQPIPNASQNVVLSAKWNVHIWNRLRECCRRLCTRTLKRYPLQHSKVPSSAFQLPKTKIN